MEYILVGIGGAFGSLARFGLEKVISKRANTTYPIATFIINVSGALTLGFVSSLGLGNNIYILLADGFLGAYTTFSTFMYEGLNLFQQNEKLNAFVFLLGSLLLGIIGFVLGAESGRIIKLIWR